MFLAYFSQVTTIHLSGNTASAFDRWCGDVGRGREGGPVGGQRLLLAVRASSQVAAGALHPHHRRLVLLRLRGAAMFS